MAGSHLRARRPAAEDCGAFGCGGSPIWIGGCFGNACGFGAAEGFGIAFGVGFGFGIACAVAIAGAFDEGTSDDDEVGRATTACNTDPRGAGAGLLFG